MGDRGEVYTGINICFVICKLKSIKKLRINTHKRNCRASSITASILTLNTVNATVGTTV
jgi:hypothetical protein